MLRCHLGILFAVTMFSCGNAQKVFTVDHPNEAQAILFETNVKSEADILIYNKIRYSSAVNPEKGLWLDVKYRSDAQWLVYWSDRRNESCVVYFVPYRSQARRNSCYLDSDFK